jgi:cyclopropane-fatty-acyl-phospholipid synthase
VRFHGAAALAPLAAGDHLGLAEAHLRGEIDVEGDLLEVMRATEVLVLEETWLGRLRLAARLWLRSRKEYDRESIAFHYDRPPEFFLPWLGRWRCYSHGLFAAEDEGLDEAMARKMQVAIDRLGLRPGMHVFDMGGGWGCFVEYAGRQGIHVHAITISEVQHRFVRALIEEQGLPCSVELVNFREYRPSRRFDAAVFMGTFEHNPEYALAARFLRQALVPGGRVWADFCAQRSDFTLGRFMKKYIWPGPITYVNPYRLVEAFVREGFNVHDMRDDTRSYELTTRHWGDRLEAQRKELAEGFGEESVRAFLLFLRGSTLFLAQNRTQAYHVVMGLDPAPLGDVSAADLPPSRP